jgi:hypothetical protein
MKRFKLITLALIAAMFLIAAPAQAVLQDMQASVYKWEGGMGADGKAVLTKIESGITFQVLAQGADTLETLYYPKKTTSLTNPVTTASFADTAICNKRVAFRVDPTDAHDTKVDLIVRDNNGGYTAFVADFDQYTHTIVIDERPNIRHSGIAWFTHAASSTATDTGVRFLPKTFVDDVRIEVVTADAGITINVGSEDTAAGFRTGVSLTSTGFVKDTGVITNGSTIDYTAASTYGSLLYTAITGSDAVATVGGRSYLGHMVDASGTDSELYYTLSSSGVDTAHGYLHYYFIRMR